MNRIIVAAAGSGKTTAIVSDAMKLQSCKAAIVTYTNNNVSEIRSKYYQLNGHVPNGTTIAPWFSFVLRDLVRPYQNNVVNRRVSEVHFTNSRSVPYVRKTDIRKYYFDGVGKIYSDKISEFALLCEARTGGAVLRRLRQLYERIYIDEVQDLSGYDLELLEALLCSPIEVTAVGDYRQATFTTSNSAKNSGYLGTRIVSKFNGWEAQRLCKIEEMTTCYRCNQKICDFADSIFPNSPRTQSANFETTGHDGLFLVRNAQSADYIETYRPRILRYDKKTSCEGYSAINFGASKGLSFQRVLVFPNNPVINFLKTGDSNALKERTAAKLYVAVTRAKYSVAFVYDDNDCAFSDITAYSDT